MEVAKKLSNNIPPSPFPLPRVEPPLSNLLPGITILIMGFTNRYYEWVVYYYNFEGLRKSSYFNITMITRLLRTWGGPAPAASGAGGCAPRPLRPRPPAVGSRGSARRAASLHARVSRIVPVYKTPLLLCSGD